jgi:hypothetical protein
LEVVLSRAEGEVEKVAVTSVPVWEVAATEVKNKGFGQEHKFGAGGMAQMVEHLPSKYEALSSYQKIKINLKKFTSLGLGV